MIEKLAKLASDLVALMFRAYVNPKIFLHMIYTLSSQEILPNELFLRVIQRNLLT